MLLLELINIGIKTISQSYPEREAREMVYLLLDMRIGTKRHTHVIEPQYEVDESHVGGILSDYARLSSGEPIQYVIGKAYFYGREFKVGPDVLIPRQETEILCREVCSRYKEGARILDMCTGSGCIAWTLALELPGSEVYAVDISESALSIASSQSFDADASPVFRKADVLESPLPDTEGFDIIVSNPPYVMDSEKALMRSNVLDHEPHLALFVSDDDPLLFYRAIASWAGSLLKAGGFSIVEINEALGKETCDLFAMSGFSDVKIIKDLSGRDRFVYFRKF